MRESSQYLRFNLGGVHYLLSSSASEAIELRDNLTVNTAAAGNVGAWRSSDDTRWSAYCLGRDLRVSREDAWERAIFLDARPNPVGLLANQVQMLPSGETEVVPFTPLGPPGRDSSLRGALPKIGAAQSKPVSADFPHCTGPTVERIKPILTLQPRRRTLSALEQRKRGY